ncbi:MAG TPA: DUF1385 domain-containing protein [bacterium]|nr:DUF1385 domain-containing protein [bacterium]
MPDVTVGGQAVLEGVMMRAPGVMTVAVRRQDGTIVIHKDELTSPAERFPVLKWPFVRGLMALGQSLALGFKALDYSSAIAMDDIDRSQKPAGGSEPVPGTPEPKGMSTLSLIGVIAGAMVLGIGFFFFIPLYLTEFVASSVHAVREHTLLFNAVDGIIRVIFLIAYVWAISLMPDIRRVFQYHGAEHKAIFAYEAGCPLTPDHAKPFPTLHPRCGTAFLLTVMLVAILVFSLIPSTAALWLKAISRIVLLPVIAGVSFEIIRKSGESDNRLLRAATAPGLWLQRITTREPDDQQLEVGIAALQAALSQSRNDQYDIIV